MSYELLLFQCSTISHFESNFIAHAISLQCCWYRNFKNIIKNTEKLVDVEQAVLAFDELPSAAMSLISGCADVVVTVNVSISTVMKNKSKRINVHYKFKPRLNTKNTEGAR